MPLLRIVQKTIENYSLLSKRDKVLIALSGGPDSVAVTLLMCHFKKTYDLTLEALYINHNLRPSQVKKEISFCRQLCKSCSIPLSLESVNVKSIARLSKRGLEETGREIRYELFERYVKEKQFDKVVLGHHRDDRVETILFRLIRGSGRTGLVGIPAKRGPYIRPLFDVDKKQIVSYLKKRKQEYCTDSTNATTAHRRNYLRNILLPTIRDNLNPAFDNKIIQMAETIVEEEAHLHGQTEKELKRWMRFTPAGKAVFDLNRFSRQPLWLQRRIVREIYRIVSPGQVYPDRDVINRLLFMIEMKKKGLSLPGAMEAQLVENKLIIRNRKPVIFSVPLKETGETKLSEINSRIRQRVRPATQVKTPDKRRSKTAVFDKNRLAEPLFIRTIQPGDRIQLLGMKGHKKISNYLTDLKIPSYLRDEIPLLCDQRGVIWIVGLEIAERVKITSATKEVCIVDFLQSKRDRIKTV